MDQKQLILKVLRELRKDTNASPKIAYNLHESIRSLINGMGSLSDVIMLLEHEWEE